MGWAGAGPAPWVPRIELAADGEKQVQCLVEFMGMVSDSEGGGEDTRGLGVGEGGVTE